MHPIFEFGTQSSSKNQISYFDPVWVGLRTQSETIKCENVGVNTFCDSVHTRVQKHVHTWHISSSEMSGSRWNLKSGSCDIWPLCRWRLFFSGSLASYDHYLVTGVQSVQFDQFILERAALLCVSCSCQLRLMEFRGEAALLCCLLPSKLYLKKIVTISSFKTSRMQAWQTGAVSNLLNSNFVLEFDFIVENIRLVYPLLTFRAVKKPNQPL